MPTSVRNFGGYTLEDRLHDGPRSVVYRARPDDDAGGVRRVVLKIHRDEHPSERDVARYQLACDLGQRFDGVGIIEHLGVARSGSRVALVTEDYGAVSLNQLRRDRKLSLDDTLNIAIQAASALARIHTQRIVHKDITPANIVVHPDTLVVKIIDFGIASDLGAERAQALPPGRLEGTMAYLSPEQTGRMNRRIDDRTDQYSFGATLYELLTGRPPFSGDDVLQLIHAKMAQRAPSPHELKPSVPKALSDIVMKLLAKTAEERYLSDRGLLRDLERCRDGLRERGAVEDFAIADGDVSSRLHVSERLYGREREIATLLGAFERVAGGGRGLLVVAGYSGIGKSAVVQEVYKPITAARGRFCSGKFDQFKRDQPYKAFSEALDGLVRQLLSEPGEDVAVSSGRLLAALGDHGQLVCDVVPSLSLLLGPQPPVAALGPLEARNRFERVMTSFVRALARPEYPLVIFIDDLQWADHASLHLIELLLADHQTEHLLLIGAYRDNEVSAAHPLSEVLARLEAQPGAVERMHLGALSVGDLTQLIVDSFGRSEADSRGLAELLHAKCAGNPFFALELLGGLYEDGLVRFDLDAEHWAWSLDAVAGAGLTDNVVDMMSARLRKLPEAARAQLGVASCLGSQFEHRALSWVNGESSADTARSLEEAVRSGYIIPIGSDYRYLRVSVPASSEGATDASGATAPRPDAPQVAYRFLHDRVQQAAYALVPESEREALHLRIGRTLLERLTPAELDEQLINVVDHLNLGRGGISAPDELARLADLNLRAGRRSKASMAFEPALRYLRTALELLPAGAWTADYPRALAVHNETVEAAFLTERFDEMEALATVVDSKARSLLDRIDVETVRIQADMAQANYRRAVDTALRVLASLGVKLPRNPNQAHVVAGVMRTKLAIGRRSTADLARLPEMTGATELAAMRVLMSATSPAFYGVPDLFPLIIFKMVSLSVRHGNSATSAYGYSVFGMVLCGALGDAAGGYAFAKLGFQIMDRFDAKPLAAKINMVFHGFVRHWTDPLPDSLPGLQTGWESGLEQGDVEYGVYCGLISIYYSIFRGRELAVVLDRFADHTAAIRGSKQAQSIPIVECWTTFATQLGDSRSTATRLVSADFDAEKVYGEMARAKNFMAAFQTGLADGVLAYHMGDHARALKVLVKVEAQLDSAMGLYLVPIHALYTALAACAAARAGRPGELRRAGRYLKKLRGWAKSAPLNHSAKAALVEAELHRARGRRAEAEAAYETAARAAREAGFVQEQALVYECMGESLYERLPELGVPLLSRARQLYARWGAHAVAAALDRRHGEGFASQPFATQRRSPGHTVEPGASHTATTSETEGMLDLGSVMKAARSLSQEIELDPLLSRIMDVAIENAGAQRGVLLRVRDGQLVVEAACSVGQGFSRLDAPLSGRDDLPRSVIEFSQRSGESVLLTKATDDATYGRDPYVAAAGLRSVMTVPVVLHGAVTGILYMENNLAFGAFTDAHRDVMLMLGAQIAVAIENAELFAEQRKMTESFARFVPTEFLEHLGRDRLVDVALGDSVERDITVLFSDLRGFTTLSESMGVTENFQFLNAYLERMEPLIQQNGGFIDKFIGDAIMALFPASPLDAVKAGLAMQHALAEHNAERHEAGRMPLEMGIGIHSGSVMLGTVGSASRMETTVIGDTVNLASRIEGLTKTTGAHLLLSEDTFRRLPQPDAFMWRRVGRVRVKGRAAPCELYEVFDANPPEILERKRASRDAFARGIESYFGREFGPSAEAFRASLSLYPADPVAQSFLERASESVGGEVPEGWDGVENMPSK
ncbi:MAG: AAA family ATPase [Myxococcota bacterium]